MSRSTNNQYVGANFELPFGKHKGKLLGDLIELNYKYILWIHNKNVFKIEQWIVDKCEMKNFDDLANKFGFTYYDEYWKD